MRFSNGFTLVELVTVIVLVGILSVAVAPRMFNTSDFTQRGFHDELKQALRYAQKSALTSGCRVTFSIAANTYSAIWPQNACPDGTPAADTPVPGFRDGTLQGTAPNGTAVGNATFTFDAAGRTATPGVIAVGSRTITGTGGTGSVLDLAPQKGA